MEAVASSSPNYVFLCFYCKRTRKTYDYFPRNHLPQTGVLSFLRCETVASNQRESDFLESSLPCKHVCVFPFLLMCL